MTTKDWAGMIVKCANPQCVCGHPWDWHQHAFSKETFCVSEGECVGCAAFRPADLLEITVDMTSNDLPLEPESVAYGRMYRQMQQVGTVFDATDTEYDRALKAEACAELRAENGRLANELVEYAKLAAAGTAEQQATIERLRAAARLPDPTYASTDGRVCCVYCGSIEENGHSEACPWVKLNVLLSLDKCR